jgi:hypothetical protein
MDLNQLLYHHQMALMAVSQARRDGHLLPNFDLPGYYAKRINEYRERRGLMEGFPSVSDDRAQGGPRADPPEGAEDYPVFVGDTLIAELLVNEALAMSDEERASYALGDVVGRLAEVQEEIWIIGRDIYRALGLDEDKLAALAAKLPAAPNAREATPRPPALQSRDGIEHILVEQFKVGPFRYSNIDDARAALRRQCEGPASEEQANDA